MRVGVLDSVIGGRDDLDAFERARGAGCTGVEVMLLTRHLRGAGKPASLRAAKAATGLAIPTFVLDEHNFGGIASPDPSLAADREHANVLRAYLREDAIPPLPLRRIAAAFPAGNVDEVYQKVLGNRNFTWRQHGDGMLRKRKPGYYADEPFPGVAVLSDRVLELARGQH